MSELFPEALRTIARVLASLADALDAADDAGTGADARLVSAAEAAETLGVTDQTIWRTLSDSRLIGVKIGRV